MALSGSVSSTNYSGRYIKLDWTATQSTANNTSTISWTLKGAGTASAGWYMSGNFKVIIDGSQEYFSADRIQLKDGTVIASGSKTINHNSDGTKSFSISIEAGIYTYAVNCKGSGTFSLNQILRQATLTSVTSFDSAANPSISYTNPAGNAVTSLQVCISLDNSTADIAYRNISKTGTVYHFTLTDAERQLLIDAVPAIERRIYFILKTVIGSQTYYSSLPALFMKFNATGGNNPQFTTTITDTNSSTIALTGNSNVLIRYCSTAQVVVDARAVVGSIASAKVTNNNITKTGTVTSFPSVPGKTFTCVVTDTQGNSTTKTVTPAMIDYYKPSCSYDATMSSTSATLVVSGSFFNGNFGAATNTIAVQYRYKKGEGSYTGWYSIPVTVSGSKYTGSTVVTGLSSKTTYSFEVRAVDKLLIIHASAQGALATTPVFDWGANDFRFNVPVYMPAGFVAPGMDKLNTIQTGYWSPTCANIGSYTSREGWYMKIGDICVIGWNLVGTVSSVTDMLYITGIPFPCSSAAKWDAAGGGNITNASSPANHTFSGYTLETEKIYARTVPVSDAAAVRASGYMGTRTGQTLYSSGMICYMVET